MSLRDYERPLWMNKDGSYMSEDQIVKHIITRAAGTMAQTMWRTIKLSELAKLHSSKGREIRNEYGLWDAENPHTVQAPGPGEKGYVDHPLFPDQVSFRVMQRVWGEHHR